MRNGFKFKNGHSNEFGIVSKTKSRALLPSVKSFFYGTPLMDGSYDFSAANAAGREFYDDRIFELEIQIGAGSLAELERKCAGAAAWLRGSGDLIFDSMPAVKWRGRFVSDMAFAPERRGKKAVVSAVFQSTAIGRAAFTTGDGIRLGDAVPLDSDIPLDMSAYFEKRLMHGENTVDFINLGDFYVRPVLRFCFGDGNAPSSARTLRAPAKDSFNSYTGAAAPAPPLAEQDTAAAYGDGKKTLAERQAAAAKNITVTYGDSKIMLEGITADAAVDLEKCVVADGSGNSLMNKMQGNFFELPPGRSTLSVYVSAPCTLIIDYTPQTIYDFDFSSIDWGDADA